MSMQALQAGLVVPLVASAQATSPPQALVTGGPRTVDTIGEIRGDGSVGLRNDFSSDSAGRRQRQERPRTASEEGHAEASEPASTPRSRSVAGPSQPPATPGKVPVTLRPDRDPISVLGAHAEFENEREMRPQGRDVPRGGVASEGAERRRGPQQPPADTGVSAGTPSSHKTMVPGSAGVRQGMDTQARGPGIHDTMLAPEREAGGSPATAAPRAGDPHATMARGTPSPARAVPGGGATVEHPSARSAAETTRNVEGRVADATLMAEEVRRTAVREQAPPPREPIATRTHAPAQDRTRDGSRDMELTLVDEEERSSHRQTMNVVRNAGYVMGEVDRIAGRKDTGGTVTSAVSGTPGGETRVVEKLDNSNNSGSQSGEQQQENSQDRQAGAGKAMRGGQTDAAHPQNASEPTRQTRMVQQGTAAADKALIERLVAAKADVQPNSAVRTNVAVQHASSVIGVILKKAYGNEETREKDAAKFVALILKTHGLYTYEHCTRLIDLATSLADQVGARDPETRRRIEDGVRYKDVGEVECLISRGSQRQREALSDFLAGEDIARAGLLHDIGKIKIPKEILYKPGMLTPDEAKIMQMHPIYGAQILEAIPPLAHAAPAARSHHERWDGKGYPDRLKGEEIPLEARIVSIVDCFDAMMADRPYRKGLPMHVVRNELWKGRGKQFDPVLVEAFMDVLDEKFERGHMGMEDYKLGLGA